MKFIPLILLCLYTGIITSCKSTENKSNETVYNLNVSDEPLQEIPDYSNAKIIKLETSTSCLINVIQKIEMNDSFIFILDFDNLYTFTREGKFVAQIGRKGEGPDEYILLNAFYVDNEKQQVTIIDDFKNILINYDFTGKYVSTVSIPTKSLQSCTNVLLTTDNNLLCFHKMDMYDTKAYSLFNLEKKEVIGRYFSYQPIAVDNYMYAFSWHPMARANKDIDIIMPLCDTIFTYSALSSSFQPKYIIETPQEMAPKNRINKNTTYSEEISKLAGEGFFTGFTGIFETDTKVLLEYKYQGMGLGYFLFDKVSKSGNYYLYTWDYNTEMLPFFAISYAYKNVFVAYQNAETLLSLKNVQDKGMQESIKDLKEDDNPCLVLYEFK